MRAFWLVIFAVGLLTVAGCRWFEPEPPQCYPTYAPQPYYNYGAPAPQPCTPVSTPCTPGVTTTIVTPR